MSNVYLRLIIRAFVAKKILIKKENSISLL